MKKSIAWLAAVAVAAASIALFYYYLQKVVPVVLSPLSSVVAPTPQASAEPEIHYPVLEHPAPKPLPALSDSDAALREALTESIGGKSLAEIVVFPNLVRRIVATVDNLPRQKVAVRLRPITGAPRQFLVSGSAGSFTLAPNNSARYSAHVGIAEAVATKRLISLYVRFYPLFQQAYQELGYPKGYFNDRLVAVIDDLLAAPEVQEPLRLTQPKVMYEYADPELEALSAGQKILIRMGNTNAARIKAKLRDIRGELIGLPAKRPN